MKLTKRSVILVMLTAVLLLVSAFPAAAQAQKIAFTGKCELLAFAPWGIDPDPNYRYWVTRDETMDHWRNQVILFYCDYTDDRLNGYFVASDNWNMFSNEHSAFEARTFTSGYVSDELGNDLGLWNESGVGWQISEDNFGVKMIFRGKGIYQGMQAKMVWTGDYPWYYIQGELLVPGK